MTIDDYRVKLRWSKARLAHEAGIDVSTLSNVISGKRRVYKVTAEKIASAISRGLGYEITYRDLEGIDLAD